MAGAQDAGAVGDHLPVELLGFGAAALAGGQPGQDGAGGEGVGMVIAEDAVLLREGLRRVLTDAGLEVAGVAGDAAQLLQPVAAGV